MGKYTDQEKVEYIFIVLTKTRMPIAKFAEAIGVSRNTLHKWKREKGANINDKLRLDLAFYKAERLRGYRNMTEAQKLRELRELPWRT